MNTPVSAFGLAVRRIPPIGLGISIQEEIPCVFIAR